MYVPVIAQPLVPRVPRAPLRSLQAGRTAALAQGIDKLAFLAVCGLVFTVPIEEMIRPLGGRTLSQWLGILAVGLAVLRTLALARARKPVALHYLMLLLVVWSGLTSLWSVARADTLVMIGTYVQLLVLVWLVWELASTPARIATLLQAYVCGSLISSGEIAYNAAIGRDSSAIYAQIYGYRGVAGDRFTAGGFNLNDLGLLLALGVPMSVYLLSRRQPPLLQFLCWLHLVLCPIAILLTASRGSVIALIVALYSIPLALPFWSAARRGLCFAVAAVCALCAAWTVPGGVWLRLLETSDQVQRWDLSERTSIWSAGLELFRGHPLAGIGAGSFPQAVSIMLGSPQVAHNTFVSVLVELGVIGMVLFCLILLAWVYGALRLPPLEKRLWLTIFLSWLVGVCSLTWEYRKTTWIILALVAAQIGACAVRGRDRQGPALHLAPDRNAWSARRFRRCTPVIREAAE